MLFKKIKVFNSNNHVKHFIISSKVTKLDFDGIYNVSHCIYRNVELPHLLIKNEQLLYT